MLLPLHADKNLEWKLTNVIYARGLLTFNNSLKGGGGDGRLAHAVADFLFKPNM